MRVVSVCLTDIPKDRIKKSEKNGKYYVSLLVSDRQQPDNYGNDLSVSVSLDKEERAAKVAPIYVGSGRNYSKPKEEPIVAEILNDTSLNDLGF